MNEFFVVIAKRCFLVLVLTSLVGGLAARAVAQENWTRFRGPDATGVVADDARLPDTWSKEKNVLWKAPIPGWGWGSPIVWGDKVFVSAVHSDNDYE
ncbi:MAG: hypothetical protein GY888_25990, partial [Planctomycetaceae bacterium]|nr:hypothetical protein [Planctomycetaceae bacterium]